MEEYSLSYHSGSSRDTLRLGQDLGNILKEGDVIALVGELGSGKTWFTKGIALGLEVPKDMVVTSPSFALVNEYTGRCRLFHMDIYRLDSREDFLSAGLDEYFYENGVVALEWADRWSEILPEWRVVVEFLVLDEFSRQIRFSGYNTRALEILRQLEQKR